MSCRSLYVLLYFLAIVVSILLRFTYYNYPFEIFRVFLFHERVVRTTFDIYVSITSTQYTINRNLDTHSKYITENK
jgi:O-antigen/teichoic acid export membrane protein